MDEHSKGQASVETLLLLAAVLIVVSSLYFMGRSSGEATNALSAARAGAENAMNTLAVENGVEVHISDWFLDDDVIVLKLTIQGTPPPENGLIENVVEESVRRRLFQVVGGYDVRVETERRVFR